MTQLSSVPATEVPDGREQTADTRRWRGRTRILVALTVAWSAFVVLDVALTGRWWPWFVIEAVPPLALVAVPLLLLALVPFARPVRRWLAVVLFLLALAGAHLAGYGPPGTDAAAPADTPINVFAWNTGFWQMTDDKDGFYSFLRRQDADVYLLQEYLYWTDDGQPIRIDDTARLREEFPGYQLLVQGELLTVTRLPVVGTPNRPVPATGADWFWHSPKAQRTDILAGGRTVSLYNVHLPAPFRFEGSPVSGRFYDLLHEQDVWRADEVAALRTDLDGNHHPSLVAGDFNSPWMQLYPPGRGVRVHSPPQSWLPARSWPASEFSLPRLWRLDWLFTAGDLAVTSYHFGDGGTFSDHSPQQIRVAVPARAHQG